jgi:hypothetical protein
VSIKTLGNNAWFDVLSAVFNNCFNFWDTMPCSPVTTRILRRYIPEDRILTTLVYALVTNGRVLVCQSLRDHLARLARSVKVKKVKLSLQQAVEAHRVVRHWGPAFSRQSAYRWRWVCQPYAPAAVILQEDSWYSFLLEAESISGHSAAGRIRSIEKSNYLNGNRIRDLPACSMVPQPTTPPRAPLARSVLCIYDTE